MSRRQPLFFILLVALVTSAGTAFAEQPAWVSRGPVDVGYVTDMAAADGAVYAATYGGVYRLAASGQAWELAGLGDQQIWQIAVRPGSAIYAVGTLGALFVSRDGGDSWTVDDSTDYSVVTVDPAVPSIAYAGTWGGVLWKSADSGLTWQRVKVLGGGIFALEIDPRDGALMVLNWNGLSRSADGAATFTPVSINGQGAVAAIGSSGTAPGRFYAATQGQLCWTSDGAATWTCSPTDANLWSIVEIPPASAGGPFGLVAASDQGVLVSADDGATWSRREGPLGGYIPAVALDAATGAVYAGTDEGIYLSSNRGVSWNWLGTGLRSSWITALALDPSDSTNMLASAAGYASRQGLGLLRSSDAGETWSRLETESPPSGFTSLLIDPLDPDRVYGASNGFGFRSEDGGASWRSMNPNSYTSTLAIDARSPATLWAGDGSGVRRSTDQGATWQPMGAAQLVYSLAFDGHDPATLYAGSYYDTTYGYYSYGYPQGGSIFVSRDLGLTWARGDQDLGGFAVAVAADPFAGGAVYAGTSGGGVWRSGDAGLTWEPSDGTPRPFTVTALVADPVRPGHLYAAADGTFYRSGDGGGTWELFADGLVAPGVTDLEISPDGRRLHAATSGAGIFEIALESAVPSFPCAAEPGRLCLVGGRYAVDVTARSRGLWNAGAAHALTDRSGYFGFAAATGDAAFPEVVVKMLPDGALGPGGPGIFHASLTTLPYVVTLTDTLTGRQHLYTGNRDALCGGADMPFPDAAAAGFRPESAAAPADAALSLLAHRFSVTLAARNPRTGRESSGLAVASGDRWGYFSMPDVTGDPSLPEVVVKMVDFTAITGKFWFFHTGLTGFDYTLTVTDSVTGAVRTYESPGSFCGAADTEAFAE